MRQPTLSLFNRFILRDVARNTIRTLLTICGIGLGVAVFLAISLANHTALAKFNETVDLVAGKANLEIRATGSQYLSEEILQSVRWIWSLGGKLTPMLEEYGLFGSEKGPLVQVIGIDMLADPDFKSYQSSSGSTEPAENPAKHDSSAPDGTGAQTAGNDNKIDALSSRAAFVGSQLASNHDLHEGDSFDLILNDRQQSFKVASILSAKGLGGAFSGNIIVMDIRTAQDALRAPGKLTSIAIILPEEALAEAQNKLAFELPPATVAQRPSQRGAQIEKMTRSFEYNLLALTCIALMVGMFLIYNTMTISVIRRRPEIGTLRAIGVSGRQVLSLFLIEALAFGLVGTTLGIIGGVACAHGALQAISKTFEHFYFKTPLETVSMDSTSVAWSFIIGVGLTVLASMAPALEATNVLPAEACRRSSFELKAGASAPGLAILAFVMLAIAVLAALQPAVNNFPVFGYLSAVCTIFGAGLLMPQILNVVIPLVSTPVEKLFGTEGRLAARCLHGTLARTAVASGSLMIGIAMMISLAIMIGSFRRTVMVWVDQTLKADLWIQSAARAGGNRQARMSPETVEQIKKVAGVEAVDTFVEQPIIFRGDRTNLGAGDFEVVGRFGDLLFTSGESAAAVCRRVGAGDGIVSETFANKKNIKQGDTIAVSTPRGDIPIRVQGIYYDYATDLGYIVIPHATYNRIFDDRTISSAAVYLKAGVSSEGVRSSILAELGNSARLRIRNTKELRNEALKVFDRTFAITYALHTIAIVVALLSVMNTLFALTMESKRDFGVLRYLGTSASQLRKIVLVEAGLLGAIGNVGGLILGFALSLLLIHVINKQSFGWTVQFSWPTEFICLSSLLVFVTALLSGLIPAGIAAKTLAPEAVREE